MLLTIAIALAPTSAVRSQRVPDYSAEATAVVLDVVVRDSRGRPVTGLTVQDFEVREDRKLQTITIFSGPAANESASLGTTSPSATAVRGSTAVTQVPRVVAVVFEQLGPTARLDAVEAARHLVSSLDQSDFVGVFAVDRAVHVLRDYASPSDDVRAALDSAAARPGMPLRRAGVVPGAEFGEVARGAPTQETRDEAKRARGMATLDALARLVSGLALLPGRKMLVLFSEGLALDSSEEVAQIPRADGPRTMDDTWLTDGRFDRFRRLLEQANAAQVAFYTFDAAGLRVEGPFAKDGFGRAPHVGLQALAEGTGGDFVENTNDLAPGAVRAARDQASYYILGYAPSKRGDGEYRSLDVRVRCEGCRVLTRRGYRATPAPQMRQIGGRDVAPFLLLEGESSPIELPATLQARIISGGRAPMLAITATLAASAVTADGVVTFLARVKDETGKALAVVSQHFERRGAADGGAVLKFDKHVAVANRRGTVELVAYDHASRRATVLRRAYDPSQ